MTAGPQLREVEITKVFIYGGHVTSWRSAPPGAPPGTESAELLFLSEKAEFADGKAIRGGVPYRRLDGVRGLPRLILVQVRAP